jgi:uncharacterized protein (TIGR04255 family)
MPGELPHYDHEVFENSPLNEVVCQLRFNEILAIGAAHPVEFQEAIRSEFPILEREHGLQIGVVGNQVPIVGTSPGAWQFRSEKRDWVVSLATPFVALKTTAYLDFQDFWGRFKPIVEAFERVYRPGTYVRVGLRYVNHVFRYPDEDPTPWSKFFNDRIAGEHEDPVIGQDITAASHHLVLQRPRGQVGMRFSRDVGQSEGRRAERFTLDFDHFIGAPVRPEEVESLLAEFNDAVYRLFRWCVTDDGIQFFKKKTTEEKPP